MLPRYLIYMLFFLFGILFGVVLALQLADSFYIDNHELIRKPSLNFADGSKYFGDLDENGLLAGEGEMVWPDGGRYEGEFTDGRMHGYGEVEDVYGTVYRGDFTNGMLSGKGQILYESGVKYEGDVHQYQPHGYGKIEFENGDVFEGNLKKNLYSGDGTIVYADGSSYKGSFFSGNYNGKGVFTTATGDVYEGIFRSGSLEGKGNVKKENGEVQEGYFKDWLLHGEGRQSDPDGNIYSGVFEYGSLEGEGEYISASGNRYIGDFEYSMPSGVGKMYYANGDIYEGEFSYGMKDGEGVLTYASPIDGIKSVKGLWQNDNIEQVYEGFSLFSSEQIAEHALYHQQDLLDDSFNSLDEGSLGNIEMYSLLVGAYGREEVFNREINYIKKHSSFYQPSRTIILSNSRRNIHDYPMATTTSLEGALSAISGKMNKKEDVLFVYITSHGNKEKISFQQNGVSLTDLTSEKFKNLIDASGIKWKIIVISACYSGSFIDPLKDDYTLVITSSSKDRKSFGCDDDSTFTYFGEAFFKHAEPEADSIEDMFDRSSELVLKWEREKSYKRSEPQIFKPSKLLEHINAWQKNNFYPGESSGDL